MADRLSFTSKKLPIGMHILFVYRVPLVLEVLNPP